MQHEKVIIALACMLCLATAEVFFEERFQSDDWAERWVKSEWKDDMGKWKHGPGEWFADGQEENAKGIITQDEVKNHAISAKMKSAVSTTGSGKLVVQFTAKHEQPKGDSTFCGGGYIKLLPDMDQATFGGDTEYAIMFGPDLCGYDIARIHLIFRHKGENLLKEEDIPLAYDEKDKLTHLYTLVLDAEKGEYEVLFDQKSKSKGALADGWAFPSPKIPDPSVTKPTDWVEEEQIADPNAVKPAGWDETPQEIADPEATKPEDWIDEDDGEFEPPMVPNPEYKGEWVAPMIDNPDYKGEWEQPMMDNPDYAPDTYAKYSALTHVGFELWTVNMGSLFDNVLVTDDLAYAEQMAEETFALLKGGEKAAQTSWEDKKNPGPADSLAEEGADDGADADGGASAEESALGDVVDLEDDADGAQLRDEL